MRVRSKGRSFRCDMGAPEVQPKAATGADFEGLGPALGPADRLGTPALADCAGFSNGGTGGGAEPGAPAQRNSDGPSLWTSDRSHASPWIKLPKNPPGTGREADH